MADAAVAFLLNNLQNLLLHHSDLITDITMQIRSFVTDLRLLHAFLKDSQRKRIKDDRKIRDVIYEMEDLIDAFVTQALEKKSSVRLHNIGIMVEEFKQKVARARIDFAKLRGHVNKYEKNEVTRQNNLMVGFVDVMEELIMRLTTQTDYFDVVCLVGMFGLGKTTAAWKIFNDPAILYEFPIRIWLPISQEFSDKDIFLAILKEFTTVTDDIRLKDDKTIARMVAQYLENGSFLIVFDDVWTCGDWDRIKDALPSNNKKGKVLITSRIEDVGKYACNPRLSHKLRFLTQEESWELLRLEALGKLDCPLELETVGQFIARDCDGLPLAIVIIGGILATMYWDTDLRASQKAWEKVSTQVTSYLLADREDRMNNLISLSYDRLPYHLRACFLYLGTFPEDYAIPASKLILMWIGEGFIQQSNDSSLEETGEKYLEDLISRNLVRTEKLKLNGKVKTCRIHDALRDFCRTEAVNENENFLHEIKSTYGVFSPPLHNIQKYRRLSLHSNCLNFISSKPFGPRVRSFICFSADEFILQSKNVPDILKAFMLLRVVDVKPIKFPRDFSDLFKLVHLRYIAMSFDRLTLPSKFSQLWNLQTLIVDTTSKTLDVKVDIWKLIQLRHFKTNACATLPKPSKDCKNGADLQTLSTISVESCTAELFQHASNLKKLVIRGKLALLLEGKKGSLDSLGRMKNLENLKLINDLHPRPPSDGQLNGLPQPYQFPSRLKSLTLRATFLAWSNMSILGLLANLEVLKLKEKSFTGTTWDALDGGFRHLEFLHIEETDLTVWTAASHHYPRLRGLVLRNCQKLVGVPLGLAAIESFQMLDLYVCRSAVSSGRKVQEAKRKAQATFRLAVFPPTD